MFGFISKLFLVSKGFFSATHFLRTIMIGGDSAEPSKGLLILLVLAAYSLAPLPAIVPAPILSVVVAGATDVRAIIPLVCVVVVCCRRIIQRPKRQKLGNRPRSVRGI